MTDVWLVQADKYKETMELKKTLGCGHKNLHTWHCSKKHTEKGEGFDEDSRIAVVIYKTTLHS